MTPVRILATSGYPPYRLPFSSLIMVDPPMMTQELLAKAKTQNTPLLAAVEEAKMRKDIWPSRDAAREWFSKRLPYKLWTPEVLQLFVVRMAWFHAASCSGAVCADLSA